MTVDRYLLRSMLSAFTAGWLLLTAVFVAVVTAGVLADAAAGQLSAGALWRLVLLRCVIGAEVLIPTAMFFAVMFTFERLHRDRELVVLQAGGFSPLRLLVPVAVLGAGVLVLVAVLTLVARPWAYRATQVLETLAMQPDVAAMRPGYFYPIGSDLVLTASAVDGEVLQDVFARQQLPGELHLIRAERARLTPVGDRGGQLVTFESGQSMTLLGGGVSRAVGIAAPDENTAFDAGPRSPPSAGIDRRHRFDKLVYRWEPELPGADAFNRRARLTGELLTSRVARDTAEVQWRFTLPLLTFGMVLVAGVLGIREPGRVTSLRMLKGIGAYVLVFNIAAGARSAVESGLLPAFPGVWWLPLLPALVFLVVLRGSRSVT